MPCLSMYQNEWHELLLHVGFKEFNEPGSKHKRGLNKYILIFDVMSRCGSIIIISQSLSQDTVSSTSES